MTALPFYIAEKPRTLGSRSALLGVPSMLDSLEVKVLYPT